MIPPKLELSYSHDKAWVSLHGISSGLLASSRAPHDKPPSRLKDPWINVLTFQGLHGSELGLFYDPSKVLENLFLLSISNLLDEKPHKIQGTFGMIELWTIARSFKITIQENIYN